MVNNFVKYLLFFSLFVGLVWSPASAFAATKEKVYYVALGDSLAAGRTPNGSMGNGYPDYIAQHFKDAGELGTFVKNYAKSGYTTQNVLDDIVNNVASGNNSRIDKVLSKATDVTLDAGANDLLQQIKVDTASHSVTFDEERVQQAMLQVQQNLTKTIQTIKKINPSVKVYIMGYYNPFPSLPADYQTTLGKALATLNSIIQQVASNTGSTFVATDKSINKSYLPNPLDVHLSLDGYKAVANLFWNVMNPNKNVKPVVYWDGLILKKGQIGKLDVKKPINLWKRVNNKLEVVRVLNPGQAYRVYGFDGKFGGQYNLGGGMYVTKIDGYVKYKTPTKAKLKQVE